MVGAAAAIRTGIEVQDVLPGEVLQLCDPQGLELVQVRLVVPRRLDLTGRLQVQEEDVGQRRDHVEMLRDRQITEEEKQRGVVHPEGAQVEGLQRPGCAAREHRCRCRREGQEAVGARARQHHRASLVHRVRHHQQRDQAQDDVGLVRMGGSGVAVTVAGRTEDGPPHDGGQAADQDDQRRDVLNAGVSGAQVRKSRSEGLADQGHRPDGENQEAQEDQDVQDARDRISRLPRLAETDHQQLRQARSELIESRVRRSEAQQADPLPHDEPEGPQREDEQEQLEGRSRESEVRMCSRRRGHRADLVEWSWLTGSR